MAQDGDWTEPSENNGRDHISPSADDMHTTHHSRNKKNAHTCFGSETVVDINGPEVLAELHQHRDTRDNKGASREHLLNARSQIGREFSIELQRTESVPSLTSQLATKPGKRKICNYL